MMCTAIHFPSDGRDEGRNRSKRSGSEAWYKPQLSLKSPAISHTDVLIITLNKALPP